MDVLIYTNSYLSPSEAFILQQAAHLKRYEPSFLTCKRIQSRLARDAEFQVECLRDTIAGRAAEIALKVMRCPLRVKPTSWTESPKLIHAHFGMNGYVVHPLAKRRGVPLVTTFHGYDATFHGPLWRAPGTLQKRFLAARRSFGNSGSYFIAVSKFIKDRLIDLGYPSERIFQHYIGIDTAFFSPDPTTPRSRNRIVCNSRFVEYKGHRFIIDALEKVVAAGIPVELILIGKGPLRGEVEARARRIIQTVRVFDDINQAEVRDLQRSSRLCVHGSNVLPDGTAEALGLSVLEAQAVGTPVAAFRSAGVSEAVLDGKTGYLVQECSATELANAVGKLLTDDARWMRFSEAARKFASDQFDITRLTADLEGIYDHVASTSAQEQSFWSPRTA